MITNSFDDRSPAKINPSDGEGAVRVDACIITFSWMIEKYVLEAFDCKQIGESRSVTGRGQTIVRKFSRVMTVVASGFL